MTNKHFLAFFCVLLLLSANVGAYYFFWPTTTTRGPGSGRTANEAKGEARLVADRTAKKPAETKPEPAKPAAEPAIPSAVVLPKSPEPQLPPLNEADSVVKLIEHIRRENEQAPIPAVGTENNSPFRPVAMTNPEVSFPPQPSISFPPLPKQPEPKSPKPLPWIKSDPLSGPVVPPLAPGGEIAVTSAITPKIAELWTTRVEKVGNRTVLHAKLRQPGSDRVIAEFVVQCDQLVSSPADGTITTIGSVTVRGIGVNGACGKITIPLHEPRLILEQKVRVATDEMMPDAISHGFSSEILIWEPTASAPTLIRPASLGAPR